MSLSIEHARIRIRFLRKRLEELPKGKIVKRMQHGKEYDTVYISTYPKHPEYEGRYFSTHREPGNNLRILTTNHDLISSKIDVLDYDLHHALNCPQVSSHIKRRGEPVELNREYFDQLKKAADSNPFPKPGNSIEHKGILMRTKGEALIAQRLDELGYEYVYEPKVWIGKHIYPDFAVYIPEIDKVFFIEFMGALSDPNYLPSAGEKFKALSGFGFIIGRDVLFICETENSAADLDLLDTQISALVMANTEMVR